MLFCFELLLISLWDSSCS